MFSKSAWTLKKKVVLEEMKQTVENQPYGKWRSIQASCAFSKECSYNWEILGLKEHIESATLDEVARFFSMYYRPNNACLVISGAVEPQKVLTLLINILVISYQRKIL